MKCLPGFAMAVASIAFAGSVVQAQEPVPAAAAASFGTIVGLVTDAAKAPIGGATVTAIRAGGGIRSTISGSDGIYSFADVPPGSWSLTITVEGLPDVRVPSLNVVAGTATRHDIAVNITATPKPSAPALPAAPKVAAAAPAVPTLPEALQAPEPGPEVDTQTPWANVGYVGWMNGTSREKAPIFDTKFFTPEIRLDINYLQSLNRPSDHTIDGSTEEFRSGEFQIEQVSLGGDFHWDNVRARFLSMFGMFATTTPRNDASSEVGQWQLSDAYRYFSEANAGYHFDVNHGLNVDAGVFVSYVGLFSYYNFDNWTYQPSFVSSNTPWFFNGLRVQWWPTQDLKIEPWLINGWQSYAKFNRHPGFGGQILWIPNEDLKLVFNTYSIGQDNLNCQANSNNGQGTMDTLCQPQNGGNPNAAAGSFVGAGPPVNYANVTRFHEDDSVLVKYYDAQGTGRRRRIQDGVQLDLGFRLRVRRRRALHVRAQQGRISRRDALRPYVVPQRSVRDYAGRRLHEQSRPLPGPDSADQWRDGGNRLPVLHPTAGTEALSMGFATQLAVHAEGLDYLVDGSDVPAFERSVLVGTGRHNASRR